MTVTETFFALEVDDMDRAKAFYENALGAAATFSSPQWSSLHIAGVRVGLFLNPDHARGTVGLHFAVDDLDTVCAAIEAAGGRTHGRPIEAGPGVVILEATDTEGNTFTLRRN